MKHNHSGVGANVDFAANTDGSQIRSEPIRGKIFFRVGWGKTSDGVIMAPPNQWNPPSAQGVINDPLQEVLNVDGQIDPNKLEEWMTKHQIDPNDPANVELMDRVTEARKGLGSSAESDVTESPTTRLKVRNAKKF